MLSPIETVRRIRSFLTYDLEWVPGTLELRCCGVYDGERYRWYRTIREFLQAELTSKSRGRWFYAHAGGLADVQFVLDEIVQWNLEHGSSCPFQVKAHFSGSSAIIVKVQRGNNVWYFLDSYWLLRGKLSEIAESMGMKKGGLEEPDPTLPNKEWNRQHEARRRWYATVPIPELLSYNEQDCLILHEAIKEFQLRLLEMGGQLQMTLASSALQLFRRQYLNESIATSNNLNETIKPCYIASRVEVIQRDLYNANYWDINSCFPFAMTFPCPGEYLGSSRRLPDNPDKLYIADVEIEVPETYLPPLPFRTKGGRIFFPIGRWRSWFTSIDLNLLEKHGGRITEVHEVYHFASFDDLSDYAKEIYKHRKGTDDLFVRMVDKLLLNSLYGKFAEQRMKISLWIDPADTSGMEMLFPGAFLKEEEIEIDHAHVPISAFITSRGREFLYEYMVACMIVYYCDTDGFATTEWFTPSKELGGLKYEHAIRRAIFVAPKVYHLEDQDGKVINKAKGFSRLNTERFLSLLEGGSIDYERMLRIRERWRLGLSNPVEDKITKRLQKTSVPKRFTYPDGYTRPWNVDEIKDVV